jgi:DNA-binding CsgD family transcriptional regulator
MSNASTDTEIPEAADQSNVIPLKGLTKVERGKAKERWSRAALERGYSPVPVILMWGQAKLGLTPEEMNVLLQLISHWWFGGNDPFISKERIAERMGKHPRTVQTYLTSLEKKGFIRRIQRYKVNKGQDANGYDLSGLTAKLEAIAPEFKRVSEQNKLRRRRVEKPPG